MGKHRKGMERTQGRAVKMAMGLARNTPDYIWKGEARKKTIEGEVRRKADDYLVEIRRIMRMDENAML